MPAPTIAVVGDDDIFLTLMNELLHDEGYQALSWSEEKTVQAMVQQRQPDLVILDIRLEESASGWHFLEGLQQDPSTATIPIIICAVDASFLEEDAAIPRQKGCGLLKKPFDLDDLLARIQAALTPPTSVRTTVD